MDMGWQANIEYFKDYVIKTPKTEQEIRETVARYLNSIGKIEELDKRVKDMRDGWIRGKEIILNTKIPLKMLGNVELLEDGRVKQRRCRVLEEVWNELFKNGKIAEMESLIDKSLNFILDLWKYGIHETTGKIGYEFGLIGEDIILIDFGELSQKKSTAEKQIAKKYWEKSIAKYCEKEVAECFNKKASIMLTLDNLNKNWGEKL